MDSRRAETLQALSDYIQNQKLLLARTQADIERLKQLKGPIYTFRNQLVNDSTSQRSDVFTPPSSNSADKILELHNYHPMLSFADKINWEVFSSNDATPLRSLAVRTRLEHTQRSVPFTIQQSPLSALQQFVKDARKIILDPVLDGLSDSVHLTPNLNSNAISNLTPALFNDPNVSLPTLPLSLSENEDDDDDEPSPTQESLTATRKRERARTKIRELKKRKIRSDEGAGCGLGDTASDAVFVRHDTEDETVEVDLSVETARPTATVQEHSLGAPLAVDASADDHPVNGTPPETSQDMMPPEVASGFPHPVPPRAHTLTRPSRIRKPSLKLQSRPSDTEADLDEKPVIPTPTKLLGKRTRDMAVTQSTACKPNIESSMALMEMNLQAERPRSDTYKQAWSISEQHLLERLLEEIPDGERNRWAKISQAMGGRRTPRQVASRVQKYFEKLKRFGVSVDNRQKGNKVG